MGSYITQHQIVGSSRISQLAYNKKTQELFVQFTKGGNYKYKEVPKHVYLDLINAKSTGKEFQRQIMAAKPGYVYEKIRTCPWE